MHFFPAREFHGHICGMIFIISDWRYNNSYRLSADYAAEITYLIIISGRITRIILTGLIRKADYYVRSILHR